MPESSHPPLSVYTLGFVVLGLPQTASLWSATTWTYRMKQELSFALVRLRSTYFVEAECIRLRGGQNYILPSLSCYSVNKIINLVNELRKTRAEF